MAYLLIAVVGVVIVVALAAAFGKKRGARRTAAGMGGSGVTSTQPAADAPTPGRSVTATAAQEKRADRHTPSA